MTPSSPLRLLAATLALGLLSGCEKKAAPVVPPAPSPAPKVASAVPTSFEAVTRHLDPGGSSYCYFSTEQIFRWFSNYWAGLEPLTVQAACAKMDDAGKARTAKGWQFAKKFIGDLGLKDISGIGYSSIALEPGYYQDKWALHHAADKAGGLIWKIRSPQPNALEFMNYLPANTAVGSSGNLKLLPIWEALNQQAATDPELKQGIDSAIQKFKASTGLEIPALLGSLGPNYSMVLTLDESRPVTLPTGKSTPVTLPEPALAICIQVQDDVLIRKLETDLSKNPMAVKSEVEGWTVYKFNFPIPLPWLSPTIAWKPGTIALTSSNTLFSEMLAVKAGKKPGLAADARFVKLRKGMPENGSKFGYVAPAFVRTIQAFQKANAESNAALDPAAKQLVQKISSINQPSWAYAVTNDTDEGIVGIIHEEKEQK